MLTSEHSLPTAHTKHLAYDGFCREIPIEAEEIYENGDRYIGNFVNGIRTGKGEYIFAKGPRYIGHFSNGRFSGKGVYIFASGIRYIGHFSNGKLSGKGVLMEDNGKTLQVLHDHSNFIRYDRANPPSMYRLQINNLTECTAIIEATYDPNGALSREPPERTIRALESLGCPNLFLQVHSSKEIAPKLKNLLENKRIKILHLHAHGSGNNAMSFGENDHLTIESLNPILRLLAKKPLIILNSCSMGCQKSKGMNPISLAEKICSKIPDATVIAPCYDIASTAIECIPHTDKNTFTIGVYMISHSRAEAVDTIFKGAKSL